MRREQALQAGGKEVGAATTLAPARAAFGRLTDAVLKDANHALREIATIGADVISVDWTEDLGEARRVVEDRVALQGNLDPCFLYGSPEAIRGEVKSVLRKFGRGPGHVFNLGHGILPDVPPDNARAMIRAVREESPAYHG